MFCFNDCGAADFNFNTSDVLKIKNEGVSYGAVNGHLYFQIRKLYF